MQSPVKTTLSRHWPLVFIIFALQFAAGLVILVSLPADEKRRLWLGFSAPRLGLIGAALALVLISAVLAALAYRQQRSHPDLWIPQSHPRRWTALFAAALSGALLTVLAQALVEGLGNNGQVYTYALYAQRIAPLLLSLALVLIELAAWIFILWQFPRGAHGTIKRSTLVIWGVAAVLVLFALLTRFGIQPQNDLFYGYPSVPLLEWQIGLACLAAAALSVLEGRVSTRRGLDVWVFLFIWLGGFLLWVSIPVVPNAYADAPRSPNYAIYPYSDAQTYDLTAQSILAGYGFMGSSIPARPLYTLFLAGLHALAGQDYSRVIALQSLALALFPAVLYLIGRELAGRPAGMALAILAILRDVTANQVSTFTRLLTNSKLFFSELPTALLLCLFTYLLLRWARRSPALLILPAAAGGVLGLAALIRTQCAILLPVALLVVLPTFRGQLRRWLPGAALALLAFALAITPWLWRNATITGGLVFDNPDSQTMVLAQRYAGLSYDQPIVRLPAESDSQYNQRLLSIALRGARENPSLAFEKITSNWINSQVASLRIVPLRVRIQGLSDYIMPGIPFWENWIDRLSPALAVLLLLNLALVVLGVDVIYQRAGWAALLPLALELAYNFWTALFQSSGERFLVPVDWAVILYYVVGLLAAAAWLIDRAVWIGGKTPHLRLIPDPDQPASVTPLPPARVSGQGAAFLVCAASLLLGSSLPLAERLIPPRYAGVTPAAIVQTIAAAQSSLTQDQLSRMAQQPGEVVLVGRAVYPRFFVAGQGVTDGPPGFAPSAQAHLVFSLIGPRMTAVILNLPQPPGFFPDAADAWVIGKDSGDSIQAAAVLVRLGDRQAVWVDPEVLKELSSP